MECLPQKLSEAMQEVTSSGTYPLNTLSYHKSGVGGESDCVLQVVMDASCCSTEDVESYVQLSNGVINTVKLRFDKVIIYPQYYCMYFNLVT